MQLGSPFSQLRNVGSGSWSSRCASETGLSSVCPSSRFDSPPLSHFPHGNGRGVLRSHRMRPGGKRRGRKLRRTAQVDRRSVQRKCSASDESNKAYPVLFTNTPTEDSSQPNQAQGLTKAAEIFSNFCRGPIAQPPADLPSRHHLADIANYITVKNDRGTNQAPIDWTNRRNPTAKLGMPGARQFAETESTCNRRRYLQPLTCREVIADISRAERGKK